MTIDWSSFVFGGVTVIATGAVLIVAAIALVSIRAAKYRSHPLFKRNDK